MQRSAPSLEEILEEVLQVIRQLALEAGGDRARQAATPQASLEREVGLGSLERVELLVRLEAHFGRTLGDSFLTLDTASEVARALCEEGGGRDGAPRGARAAPVQAGAAAPLQPPDAVTIHEALWQRGELEPQRPSVYLREDDGQESVVTYGRLLREARAIAGALHERGVRRGDTIALMLPTGIDFLRAFQGILMCRAIPVPIYPPLRLDRLEEYARRQSAILADARVHALLTVREARPLVELLRPLVPSLEWVATPTELAEAGLTWREPEGEGSDPAFIQYTSGSTGSPKGVLLSHDNLLANIRSIGGALDPRPGDVAVSWLPLYHDMGLIGSWLFCLHSGLPIAILSPLAFLARPERWLWAIHQKRGTLSAAPNFAYELCVRRIADSAIEGLDLSSWRCALNGAEPVNPETLERFVERFAPYGFRREALLPVYGLAENSVALCFPPLDRGPRVDRVAREPFEHGGRAEPAEESDPAPLRFVSEGAAVTGHEVRVVDDAGRELPERSVGRLIFRGPSMMREYFGKPEASQAISLPGGWLDSGDLAYQAAGEIHITGRRKDLIIKGGRNLVPQEIEELSSQIQGIRKGCVAAFGVPDETLGTERLVVVAETRVSDTSERETLSTAVTQRVAEVVGVPPDLVVLVAPRTVPKTSSGKIRRAATREMHLRGELDRPARVGLGLRLRLLAAVVRSQLPLWGGRLARWAYTAYLGTVLSALAVIVWPLAAVLPGRGALTRLGHATTRLGLRAAGCRLSAEGLDRLPRQGACLLVCNHASYIDVAALMALLPFEFLFVAKREVIRWPLIGLFVRRLGHLTVDRYDAQRSVVDASSLGRAIESGRRVLVFPEGTFTAAAGLRPFRLGAFKAAVDTRTTTLPLALCGTRRVLRDGSWVPRPGPIHLWIGEPMLPEGEDWKAVVSLRDRAISEIAAHTDEPRLDLVGVSLPPRRG